MATAEQTALYLDYKGGHIYENIAYGVLNKPPGWYLVSGRWANSSVQYGGTLVAWSQDEAWEKWYISVGGSTTPPQPAYGEAMLVSCNFPANAIAGQTYQGTITVNQGSLTENYKLVFSGDLAGESMPFTINTGTGQQQITISNMVFPTGGPKTVTAALVKI